MNHLLFQRIAESDSLSDFLSIQYFEIPQVDDDDVRLALREALQRRRIDLREQALAAGNIWLPKLSIFAAIFLLAACVSAEVKPSLTVSQAVTNRTKAGASTLATVTDPKREPGASAVSGLTVRQFLSALSELESGNNDFAKGRAHEVGRYQCLPGVWRNATALPLTAATNQATAATVTLAIIRSRTGKDASELTPSQFAIAWHCPNARRLNREQRDYETRFENLFAKYHL